MPGIAKELELEDLVELRPLGEYISTMSDHELILEVSIYEARKEYCRWSINGATTAYYETAKNEWFQRHGNKHIPRIVVTREHILKEFASELFDEE